LPKDRPCVPPGPAVHPDSPQRHGDAEKVHGGLANVAIPPRRSARSGLSDAIRSPVCMWRGRSGNLSSSSLPSQTRENDGLISRLRETGRRCRASLSLFSVPSCLRGSIRIRTRRHTASARHTAPCNLAEVGRFLSCGRRRKTVENSCSTALRPRPHRGTVTSMARIRSSRDIVWSRGADRL
jgi:hypothetical protein